MKNPGLKRVRDIGEIAYLRMRNIPLVKIDTYERKNICWFEDSNNESTNALVDYYNSFYVNFYKSIKEVKDFLISKVDNKKRTPSL